MQYFVEADLRESDLKAYQNFFRISRADYAELLALVMSPFVNYKDTN